ncbi:MAG: hypothetical protein A2W99_03760 [Bacteroidetes bacterium GWF2_33_16]|nr:MAG: hypothetical protein A2X00_12170 [Bacteroidetes bacterium GWE2_32_14]OFY02299.1 MAG: hypothetical protein A2W99_03760 [Bacteroidetes bacterium GWF2_33_16]
MVNIKKIKDGIYSNDIESFEVEIQDNIANIRAITDFNFLDLKKGDVTQLNKDTVESFLNDELFDFNNL